ncbi:TPA: hypothetical protein ACHWKK_003819 [Providencia stuartii]|uniref:hypothetical protein n=1 Tax=Providencia stuartii TaxID=588 RepID=UPI002DBA241B|nr:hypothetical protein [Providencia stuartii]WRV51083.1 hypothetical protein VQ573_15685 [Providencia stuartii]
MKRILAVAAVTALLVGCDSKQDAPFGLKWGQSMDSVGFIKDGDCEDKPEATVCVFGDEKPFSKLSYYNALKFNNDGLFEVESMFVGGQDYLPDFKDFENKLNQEINYLKSIGFNQDALANISVKCKESDSCNNIKETSKTSYGESEVWIWEDPSRSIHQLTVIFNK